MGSNFDSLKKQLRFLEQSEVTSQKPQRKDYSNYSGSSVSRFSRYLLFGAFLIAFLLFAVARYGTSESQSAVPIQDFFSWVDQPDEQLLEDMGTWMEDMGYTGLTRDELIELREEGVTATFTSRMRDLGYTDLTLDELVRLRQNDVSATFSAMMKELGRSYPAAAARCYGLLYQ